MRELSRRWQCVGARLRAFQPEGVRQATAQRDVGLLGLLVVLLAWPDVTMPSGFVTGLPAVGFAHNYGGLSHVVSSHSPRESRESSTMQMQEDRSASSEDSNKLVLCSPLRPAQHIALAEAAARAMGIPPSPRRRPGKEEGKIGLKRIDIAPCHRRRPQDASSPAGGTTTGRNQLTSSILACCSGSPWQ